MSEHEGRPVVWQWQDAGSGAGHMQAVYEAAEPDACPGGRSSSGIPGRPRVPDGCYRLRRSGAAPERLPCGARRGDVMTCDDCRRPVPRSCSLASRGGTTLAGADSSPRYGPGALSLLLTPDLW